MAKNTALVSVIIPNWNGAHLLEKNLPAVIEAANRSGNKILEVIVVDDGSRDQSALFLQKNYRRKIKLVKHSKNRGFAEAVNTGARIAKGKLLCLLNSDVVPQKDFLKNIFTHFENDKTFAVVLHERGYGPATGNFQNGYFAHSGAPEMSKSAYSLWASGGSAVFSRKLWWELGGLDSELFAPFYWEDVDLGYRAWKRGYKIFWEPKSLVTHAHEATINPTHFKKRYVALIKERNELLFIWKNTTSEVLWRKHKKWVVDRIRKHPGYARVVYLAMKKRKLVLKRRAKEKHEAKVSDEAVYANFNP